MPIAGRFCRMRTVNPENREKGPYPRSIHAPSAVAPFTQGKTIGGHIGLATTNKGIRTVTMSFCPMTTAPPASPKKSLREW